MARRAATAKGRVEVGLRRILQVVKGPRLLCAPGPVCRSPLAPCPPSPRPRSDGSTPGGYAARCPVPVLWVLGSSVKVGTRTPRCRPGTNPGGVWLKRPVLDTSLFREPTRLWAFATTCVRGHGLPAGESAYVVQPSIRSVAQLACWMAVSSSRLWRASSSIRRLRGPTSTAGRIRISARP